MRRDTAKYALTWLHTAAIIALAIQNVVGQSCYYPNGKVAPSTEKPCSTEEGSACCPDNWLCLDNGLCHYPVDDLYERYSCTDSSWSSPGCPSNLCTYDGQASGAESITQCSNHDDEWCCNADAQHVNCCQELPVARPFFALQDGQSYAMIGGPIASSAPTLSSITGIAISKSGDSPPSKTLPPSSSDQPSASGGLRSSRVVSFIALQTDATSKPTSVQYSSTGVTSHLVISVSAPPANPASDPSKQNLASNNSGSRRTSLIVGCAVGIPLSLVLTGISIWLLHKRRQQKAHPYSKADDVNSHSTAASEPRSKETYCRSPPTAELDSQPFGPDRPIFTVRGHVELESGNLFEPGARVAYAPNAVGIGGGNRADRSIWSTAPPRYSRGMAPAANSCPSYGVAELDSTELMPYEKKGAKI